MSQMPYYNQYGQIMGYYMMRPRETKPAEPKLSTEPKPTAEPKSTFGLEPTKVVHDPFALMGTVQVCVYK